MRGSNETFIEKLEATGLEQVRQNLAAGRYNDADNRRALAQHWVDEEDKRLAAEAQRSRDETQSLQSQRSLSEVSRSADASERQAIAITARNERDLLDQVKRGERWMIFLTAAIAVASLASAYIYSKQLSVMKDQMKAADGQLSAMVKQLDVMRASERSWIQVSNIRLVAPQWSKDGLHFTAHFTLSNSGKSPAFDIGFAADITNSAPMNLANLSTCSTAKSFTVAHGHTLFPGETLNLDYPMLVPRADLTSRDPSLPNLIACAAYKFADDNDSHFTPLFFYLAMQDGSKILAQDEGAAPPVLVLTRLPAPPPT